MAAEHPGSSSARLARLARRRFLVGSAGVAGLAALPGTASATPEDAEDRARYEIFVNNVGYEATGRKRAIIAGTVARNAPVSFAVTGRSGDVVFRGQARFAGAVDDWRRDQFPATPSFYWIADFSEVIAPGEYTVTLPGARAAMSSWPFRIEQNALERLTLGQVAHFFRDSRSDGQFDKADRRLPISGTAQHWDAHGGWYDAAADWGKHFTQLSNLSYFNTLSIPLTAWILFAAHGNLVRRTDPNFTALTSWLLDEGLFGADYLVRVHAPGKSFYSSVSQPEGDDLGIDPAQRTLSAHQVNFREGGGLAIAALARASTYSVTSEYRQADYLAAAKDAFAYLQAHNPELTNDRKENIQDDYNALLAATELFKATRDTQYRKAADERAANLLARLVTWRSYRDYWRADDSGRPYFHPSDAGLPVISLLSYVDSLGSSDTGVRARVLDVVRRSLEFELAVTAEVPNPFGYARQLIQGGKGNRYSGFFMPHDIAPRADDVWWQGENARIASLASAARHAAVVFADDKVFSARLKAYALDQLDWILGVNPFGVCMMEGPGRAVPQYLEYASGDAAGSWRWLRSAGGIVNGITGKGEDGRGLHWDPGRASTGPNTDWRWLEQWLPHATWYLHAVSVG
ncbi:glycoside hydrolase family 9 protein [Amycolatopsis sp. NPDC059021]|uniref:glycoside hydrolase family 9 protein n=1 Tax=Amycolatopsis sp. NPDC059021 TaxID=3346704 RepID=UPI00366DF0B0